MNDVTTFSLIFSSCFFFLFFQRFQDQSEIVDQGVSLLLDLSDLFNRALVEVIELLHHGLSILVQIGFEMDKILFEVLKEFGDA